MNLFLSQIMIKAYYYWELILAYGSGQQTKRRQHHQNPFDDGLANSDPQDREVIMINVSLLDRVCVLNLTSVCARLDANKYMCDDGP